MVDVGQTAPDFIAPALFEGEGRVVKLFRAVEAHDAVVLSFAPADFVPQPTAELQAIRDAEWHTHESVAVLGITGDSLFSHRAYVERYEIPFPLVSDFHAGIADSYGLVLEEWEGHNHIPARATLVIDGEWRVRAFATADPLAAVSPAPVEEISEALAGMVSGIDPPQVEYPSSE